MQYTPYTPEEFEDLIEVIFHVRDYHPEHSMERLIPDGFASLVIELDNQERYIYENETNDILQTCTRAWISGIFDQYISISALQGTELLAIRFKPGGLFPFIPGNTFDLINKVVPASMVFGQSINALREKMLIIKEPIEKIKTLESWLFSLKEQLCKNKNPQIAHAIRQIIDFPTIQEIQNLVESSGYSGKHFIQLFKTEVGMAPKTFQRVMKFKQILPKILNSEKISWTAISYECGYYDQSHFIRDFKRFSGYNPSEFLDQDFDRTNFFPIDHPR